MKKKIFLVIILISITYIFVGSSLLLRNVYAADEDFEPDFGNNPEIDGDIDRTLKEWENASKEEVLLRANPNDQTGIPTDIWVMQNESNLFISIQFELELSYRSPNEFIAILISKSDSERNTSFYDAKIVQFYDLGGKDEDNRYRDYHISNGIFYEDDDEDGDGAADLHGDKMIYEFRIPLNGTQDEDTDDVDLEFGEYYAFKVVYGENDDYNSIQHELSSIVQIEIQYPDEIKEPWWMTLLFFLGLVVFGIIGVTYGLYIYKILILKKKTERIKS